MNLNKEKINMISSEKSQKKDKNRNLKKGNKNYKIMKN